MYDFRTYISFSLYQMGDDSHLQVVSNKIISVAGILESGQKGE